MFSLMSSDTATSTSVASASSYVTCAPAASNGGVATYHPRPRTPSHSKQLSGSMHDALERSNLSVFGPDSLFWRLLYARRVFARPALLTR